MTQQLICQPLDLQSHRKFRHQTFTVVWHPTCDVTPCTCRPHPVRGLSSSDLLYDIQQPLTASGQPFAVTVTRKATGQPVFDTRGHRCASA